jgi:hypothetical protein
MLNFTNPQFVNFYIQTCIKEYVYSTRHHTSGHAGDTNIPERSRTRLLVVCCLLCRNKSFVQLIASNIPNHEIR